jgi:acetyl esterase/lipase/ketosteroid isomerase-like protein
MSLDRVDPECRPALEAFRATARTMNELPLPERRAMVAALEAQLAAAMPVPEHVETEERTIPGPAGAPDLAIRIYRPTHVAGPRPGIYYIHGGGMVVGSLETGHAECLRFCSELGAVVVNVGYRLAPEHPHPAPGEDCFAGLAWMADHAEALGIAAERIAVYGPSAGGGLAVATALRARDRGAPQVAYVMAIYPMLDPRNVTPSSHAITDLGIYDRDENVRCWGWYLAGAEPDVYASPPLCEDLRGFPPTYIDVGTEDVFRDEDLAFAGRLLEAGVAVEVHVDPGAYHGSELLSPAAAVSQRQLRRRLAALRAALHPRPVLHAHQVAPALAGALGQPDALAELLHPEATWSLPASLGTPVQVGRAAILEFRRDLYADVLDGSSVKVAVEDVMVDGEAVAIRTRMTALTRSGLPYDNDHSFLVTLRDGQIASVRELLDAAHAVAQLNPATDANERGVVERVAPTHVKVVTSIEIDAPHDVVWGVLTDFKSLPEWSSGLQGLDGEFREGGHVSVTFRAFGRDQVFKHELQFFEDGAQFGWSDLATGLFTDRHIYRVEPLLNGRTRFIQSDEPQGAVVRFLGGMIARQTVSLYQAFNRELKARAERVHRGELPSG